MKKKNKIIGLIIAFELILQLIICNVTVKAAEYNFNFTGSTTANVGDTVTLTITATGLTGNVKLSSTNATLSDSQKWVERNSVSITARITGLPATITATPVELTDNDYNIVSIAQKTVTINAKTPPVSQEGQGSNNGNNGKVVQLIIKGVPQIKVNPIIKGIMEITKITMEHK